MLATMTVFLKWTCPASIFGAVKSQFWVYQDEILSESANCIKVLVLNNADWPGSIKVAKAYQSWSKQGKGY
jgi:hypothetical protein